MGTLTNPPMYSLLNEGQEQAVYQACQRVAPTWPLDQLIAVNPWWELRDLPLAEVSARLAALTHATCLMPKGYYAELWQRQIQSRHLQLSAQLLGEEASVDVLVAHLQAPDDLSHWHNVCDWLDSHRDRQHRMAWRDEIIHQISQFCSAYFQQDGPHNPFGDADEGLYRDWLEMTRHDSGIEILMAEPGLQSQFASLPDDHRQLLVEAITELACDETHLVNYLHALLLDINGWASWVAYLRWQNQLNGKTQHGLMEELLAIRLGWDLVLWRHHKAKQSAAAGQLQPWWRQQWARLPQLIETHRQVQRLSWIWHRAAELAFQEGLHQQLRQQPPAADPISPVLQAAFCIDVRSEVMRRALEAQHPGVQTIGFAGFFGLPLAYQPVGTDLARPQLPGLLKPAIRVSESGYQAQEIAARREAQLNRHARWQSLNQAPPATFSLVEATGLRYAFKLLKDTFFPASHRHPVNDLADTSRWQLSYGEAPLTLAEKAGLAAGILRAMGLTGGFAPFLLLVGHGSSSRNNPHAAGLDCGACGGQTGEINVRVLAQLLNDPAVRDALSQQGIQIPAHTRFIAALHNTTTDAIDCFDEAPSEQINGWLQAAGRAARRERSPRLGLAALSDNDLEPAVSQRARDWSQVRPEWGLANNACFIVAPRSRTRHLNLAGRSFLHDYDWRKDQDFAVLELIMTAPMVVTHWINMQYNASVSDNLKYGSGNKVLHNVVGGNLGVFEGNGGDLRIGLPLQSLHDGSQWMHQPLRLSVYLAAPRQAIDDIARRHAVVRELIDNDWLHLFRLGDDHVIEQLYRGAWQIASENRPCTA